MKNYNYTMSQPAVPSVHRDQADSATHKQNTVRECAENGTGAVYACSGGMYGYFVAADDVNLDAHVSAVEKLLLVGEPTRELSTVREAFDYLGWDYEAEKALFAENENNLDELALGFVTVPETEEV